DCRQSVSIGHRAAHRGTSAVEQMSATAEHGFSQACRPKRLVTCRCKRARQWWVPKLGQRENPGSTRRKRKCFQNSYATWRKDSGATTSWLPQAIDVVFGPR